MAEKPTFTSLVHHLSIDPTESIVNDIIIFIFGYFLDPKKWCKSCVDHSKKGAKQPILCPTPKMSAVDEILNIL